MYNVGVANNDGVVFIVDEDDVSNGNGEKRRKRILYDATNVVLTTRTAAQVKVQRSTVESVVAVINAVFGNLCCCFGWLLRLQWSLGWSESLQLATFSQDSFALQVARVLPLPNTLAPDLPWRGS